MIPGLVWPQGLAKGQKCPGIWVGLDEIFDFFLIFPRMVRNGVGGPWENYLVLRWSKKEHGVGPHGLGGHDHQEEPGLQAPRLVLSAAARSIICLLMKQVFSLQTGKVLFAAPLADSRFAKKT